MESNNIKGIKLGFSCHREWTDMKGSDCTRHCTSCNKSVFNFSNLSDKEVVDFLSERAGQKTCGKFSACQIENVNQYLQGPTRSSNLMPILLATTMTTMAACGSAKEVCTTSHEDPEPKVEIISELNNPDTINTIIINGQIVGEGDEPLIGASFMIGEGEIGCITDFDGKFSIEVPKEKVALDTVSVMYVGYENLQIPITDIKNKEVKIELIDNAFLLGEIVILKQPIHRRFWNRITRIFR